MAFKVGNKNFPDEMPEIMKDKDMLLMLHTFCKQARAEENTSFLIAVKKKVPADKLYPVFIAEGSKNCLNISGVLRDKWNEAAVIEELRGPLAKELINSTYSEVSYQVQSNFLNKFKKSELYLKYCFNNTIDAKKAAAKVKIKDVVGLRDALFLYFVKKTAAADKKLNGILKKEKKNGVSTQVYLELQRAGLAV